MTAGLLKMCASSLAFNPDSAQCDRPENVVCATTSGSSMSSPQSQQSVTSMMSDQSQTSATTMTSRTSVAAYCVTGCTSAYAGRFPDCNDCSAYWDCPGGGGAGSSSTCSPLFFNPDSLQCDVQSNVVCSTTSATSATSVTSLSSPSSLTSYSTLTSETSQPSQQSVTSFSSPSSISSQSSLSSDSSKSLPQGDYPDCMDCIRFIRCTSDGTTISNSCSATLLFNPDTSQCDLEANVRSICA
ncbi:hypothetical protein EGW08_016598 [Elysia chlorotica]|uniref:Chitin-binding type-2 domain-containing protein n=1 Tax=Elysia chlorotica TaxID=188477 RepID=A0A3S1BA18_ELYCH|nr:hypothetical protein EGW08_016598 [Elysia chlorotica]